MTALVRDGAFPADRRMGLVVALILALVAWTSVLFPGFVFPLSNNVFHVPIVLHYTASAEGPHDAFTQSLSGFVTLFWPALGLVATESNLLMVFFLAHLVGRLVFVFGLYGLIRHFRPSRTVALALTALASIAPIFRGLTIVGHTEMLSSYLTHTGFGVQMLPLCWLLMLRGRWIAAAAAVGLLFDINAFIAIWTLCAAGAAWWVAHPDPFRSWKRLLLPAAAFLIVAAPTLIWIVSTLAHPAPVIDFRDYLMFYFPLHTFVHAQWPATIAYAAYLAAAGMGVFLATRSLEGGRGLAAIFVAYIGVFLFGVVLPYLTGSRLLLNLYPLRMDTAINIATIGIMLAWAGQATEGKAPDRLPLAITLALMAGDSIAPLLLMHQWSLRTGNAVWARVAAALLVLAIVALAGMGASPRAGEDFVPLLLLFGLLSVAALEGKTVAAPCAAAFACLLLPGEGYQWPMLGLAGAVALWLIAPGWGWLAGFASAAFTSAWLLHAHQWLPFASAVLMTVAAALLLALRRAEPARIALAFGLAPRTLLGGVLLLGLLLSAYAARRGSIQRPDMDMAPLREAQAWTRSHLKPDEPYLPIDADGFSVLSRRPPWVDQKEGAVVMWQPSYLREWKARLLEYYDCEDTPCFADLARRHGLHWVVTPKGRLKDAADAGLQRKFANAEFEIYWVTPAAR